MAHARKTRFLGLLLGVAAVLPCRAIYRTFTDCKELSSFLKAVPNTCALFVDGGGGNKKRMLRQLQSDYVDMNVRFAVVDVRAPSMRRCAEDLYILQYPSFGIFKGHDLMKIVRGNPSEDDLRQQVDKQLVRDPQNWSRYNNKAFYMCNWAQRQQQFEKKLPHQCKQEVLPYMSGWRDEPSEQFSGYLPEQMSGATSAGSGGLPQSTSDSGKCGCASCGYGG